MYKCLECGKVFEAPKQNNENEIKFKRCPYCYGSCEELIQCEICEEYFSIDELTDTTEYINGGCGMCCEECIEGGDMVCL